MHRRNFPLVLLYGFGLALAISLVFIGFLLHKQSRDLSFEEEKLGYPLHPVSQAVWQQQLADCQRANLQKDSLIRSLEQSPNAPPPGQPITLRRAPSK